MVRISVKFHGIENPQNIDGEGVSGTDYDACVTGIGDSVNDAIEDAIELIAQVETDDVAHAVADACWAMELPNIPSVTSYCEILDVDDDDDDGPIELYNHVTIFYTR